MKYIIPLLLVRILSSCDREDVHSGKVLDADRFRDIYIALLERGSAVKGTRPDSTITEDGKAILKRFGSAADDYRATIRSFNSDPKRWQQFFDDVSKKLEHKMKEEGEKKRPTDARPNRGVPSSRSA